MSYQSTDLSVQDGAPIFLYEFVQGEQSWRYTSAPDAYAWGGHDWLPSTVSHSDITQSNEMAKDSLSLRFPRSDDEASGFARQFLGYAPDIVTSVTIRRGHPADGEFVVYWKGRVAGSKTTGALIAIECESVFTSLRRPGLRARFQRQCRHALYGRGCNIDPESVATIGRALAMNGLVVQVPEAAASPNGWYLGGMLRAPDGALRLITRHAGDQVTLSRPLESLAAAIAGSGYGLNYGAHYGGAVVKLYPGCDHSLGAGGCGKFNNIANYGGFPWIPLKNPFGGSSIV